MAEKVEILDITENNFFSHAVLTCMAEGGSMDRFNVGVSKTVDIELRINGVEVSLRAFVKNLESQFTDLVNREAGRKILDSFQERRSAIEDLLANAEFNLKEELVTNGLLHSDEG